MFDTFCYVSAQTLRVFAQYENLSQFFLSMIKSQAFCVVNNKFVSMSICLFRYV